MDTILFQNILFFTLSLFLIVITVGFAMCAVYVILVLKSIHDLIKLAKEEGGKIAMDIENFRESAKSGSMKFGSLALSVFSFLKHHKKSKKN